jgi:hypothetical protein
MMSRLTKTSRADLLLKEYDPSQPRDKRGRWSDKLKVSGRLELPEGARVLGSWSHEGQENRAFFAAIARPDGKAELRLTTAGSYDQDDDREPPTLEEFQENGYGDESQAEYEEALAAFGGRWSGRRGDYQTARIELSDDVLDELRAVDELRQLVDEESDELGREIWPRGSGSGIEADGVTNRPRTWEDKGGWVFPSPEIEAKWGAKLRRSDELSEGSALHSGVIEAEWGNIHWDVVGRDTETGKEGSGLWSEVRMFTRPKGDREASYEDLYDASNGEVEVVAFEGRDLQKLIKKLEQARADAAGQA